MIGSITKSIKLLLVICTTFNIINLNAQESQDSELFETLKSQDSLMFEIGFNQCKLDQIEHLFLEGFEFYHDKNGVTSTRSAFIKSLKENLCSSGKNPYQRILEEGTMEIFPLYEQGNLYGAVMTGKHSFGNTVARFTNLYLVEGNDWKLSKTFSYDHKIKEPKVIFDVTFIKLSSDEMSRYLGDYRFSQDFVLSIIREGDKLFGDAQGQKVEIKPYGNDRFLDERQTMKLIFIAGDSGKITGLQLEGPNGEMNAKKLN